MTTDREKLERLLNEFYLRNSIASNKRAATLILALTLAPSPPANSPVMVKKSDVVSILSKTFASHYEGLSFPSQRRVVAEAADALMSLFTEAGTEQAETRPADTVEMWFVNIGGQRACFEGPNNTPDYEKVQMFYEKAKAEGVASCASQLGDRDDVSVVRVLLPALEDKSPLIVSEQTLRKKYGAPLPMTREELLNDTRLYSKPEGATDGD